jgi:type IV pilus assembly protein PilY1
MSANRFAPLRQALSGAAMLFLVCSWSGGGWASSTDISDEPLITMSDVAAKPNIMFILDSSGSMARAYMPDEMSSSSKYGYWSAQCNGLAYNPNITYSPPVDSTGTSYSASSFSAAWSDGYTKTSTTNLSGAYYYKYSGSETSMGWTYDSSGDVYTTTTFYKQCMSSIGASPGSAVFSKVSMTSSSSDATNYANWYSYYRTRILLMRTAAGRAFSALGSGYRVGFTTISDTGITDGTNYFRNVKDFDTTQKANFYTSLYGASTGDSTPLRASLSKVGRYFAMQVSGQSYDPMEYSCQRNFAILSTDGYWNTSLEVTPYGVFKLDGSTKVGNQDGTESRPMFDGTTTTTTLTRTMYVVGKLGSCTITSGGGRGGSTSTNAYQVVATTQTSTDSGSTWTSGTATTTCVAGTTTVNSSTAAALASTTSYSSTTSGTATSGGSSNSLADVAEYYYATDLRTSTLGNCTSSTSGSSQEVCSNSIVASGRDLATWQHMTTYTIGLGVSGTLTYDKNYLTQTSGAYVNLTNATADWPTPTETSSGGDARNIDDLWHAAVNGRGQYYSALNATELSEAISGVVTSISAVTGSASAAASSKQDLVSGSSNVAFQASYTTASWTGDLQAFSVDGSTGVVSSTASWSAQTLLDNTAASARTIYFNKSGTLTSFAYSNLTATLKAYLAGFCSKTVVSTQCSSLSTANLALANDGEKLVNYLRGDRTYEASNSTSPLFRTRSHLLGDIINSAPVYSGEPPFSYTDSGYSSFKTTQASRTEMVFVGANDGMLHAFNATSGAEVWAFVPTAVFPNLYKLANTSYSTLHNYYVDGTPVVGDIYVDGAWKTILVGGFNSGAKGYYALDITTPDSPVLLWEFTDTNLGLTYGNPIIAKRSDGTWVVAFASGYNNTGGDGLGHLYVLDANAGTTLLDLPTTAGSSSTPSGLAKINAWIADSTDNTALRYYGGDLLGNLWRFDVDNLVEPNQAAMLLAKFQTSGGTAQPITIQPRLKLLSSIYPVVIVATGRYLGVSDITDTTTQSVAAFKDSLTSTGWGVLRDNSTMVEQTATAASSTVTSTSNTVDWVSKNGWWFDLPTSGERVISPMVISGNTLYLGSAVPRGSACTSGGSSWLYTISLLDGSASADLYSDSALIVGLTVLTTSSGSQVVLIKDSTGATTTKSAESASGTTSNSAHRTSWREIVD